MSSFETAVERVKEVAASLAPTYAHAGAAALLRSSRLHCGAGGQRAGLPCSGRYDHLLFSFHGLPERHLRKSDPTGHHCLASENCCTTASPAHATCYRAQCFKTVAEFVKLAGVPQGKYSVSFQSRLGRDPWLKPYTDYELPRLAQSGVRKLLVMCPAFVSDCLETLEEIGLRGRETFLGAGGSEFALIPCLERAPAVADGAGEDDRALCRSGTREGRRERRSSGWPGRTLTAPLAGTTLPPGRMPGAAARP